MRLSRLGFTLIELLVVISIIGVIAGVVLVSTKGMREKARDSRRLSDMRQIVSAISLYYDKYGVLPPITSDACCGGWDVGPCVTDKSNLFIGALQTAKFITTPVDPGPIPSDATSASCNYGYAYYVYPAGSSCCDSQRGKFFILGIRNLEAT